ncbi:MAG: OsmC family protein [Bacteroidota bacterium]
MNDSSTHSYEVNLQWDSERKGTLSSPVLPTEIEVTTPPDFPKGIKDIWTPEHLFVAAVNSCLMATFLAIAENSRCEFISFECNAVGIVGKIDGKLAVTEITLKPKVVIPSSQHEEQLKKILVMSERECAISNSINTKINLEPTITIL